ncbi:hypothetical protein Btru_022475 [Bulinus truncatus]|nr:hypothetical protein Btru_022475 [Bulinus truncatus]
MIENKMLLITALNEIKPFHSLLQLILLSTTSTTEATTSAGLKCPNIQERGSIFSATVADREATSPCPANYTGNVYKKCNDVGSWEPGDFSRCNRTSFASLLNNLTNVTTPDGVNQLTKEIVNVFKLGPSSILSGDIVKMSEVLAQLGQRTEKYNIVVTKEAVENVANVVQTLFSSDDGVWKGVSKGNNSSDAGVSGLISSMEYFTQSILNSSKFTNHDVSLGTHVDLLLWQETTNIGNFTRSGNNIVFPKNKNGSFQCYVLTYKNITGKFAINGLIDDSQNAAQSTDLTLNSDIISLSAQPKPIVSRDNPLNLTFKTQINTGKLQVCVYLTKNLTWSTEGCRIIFFPKSVLCSCSHFSTFAVLMSPSQLQPTTVYTTATTIRPVKNCPLVVKDGVVFNETNPGELFTTPCPPRYTGLISRRCNAQGDWESIDTNNCLQEVLQSVLTESTDIKETGALEKITNITERVARVMKNNTKENILSGDIRTVVEIFAEVGSASKQFNLTLSKSNLGSIINTVDKLLASEGDVWKGVNKGQNRTDAGAKLLFSLENITQGILNSNTSNFTEISLNETNIVVELKKRTTKEIAFKEIKNEITLSQLKEETFKYSIIIYKNISEKFTVGHFQDKERNKPAIEKQPKIFNSDVISFSVEPKPDSATLKKNPLILTFKLLNTTNHKQFCVYLKDSSSSRLNDSTWSTDGCTTKIEQDKVICTCTHLTNFAVLMSPYEISETHSSIISLISSIGITISLICLAVTLAVYGIMWRFVKSDRAVLHVNLSVSLFLSYTVFLVGIGKTDNSTTCGIVAGLLHFLFLVVFFVMLAEGLLIHKSVTSVSSVSILKYLFPLMYGELIIDVNSKFWFN